LPEHHAAPFVSLRAAVALLAIAVTANASAQPDFAPGDGMLCAAALYHATAQAAKRCYPDEAVELQAELGQAVERIDAFILANSDWTLQQLAAFNDEQARVESGAKPCEDQAVEIFRKMMKAKPESVRAAVDLGTARAGKPTWGVSPRDESIDDVVAQQHAPTWRDCL